MYSVFRVTWHGLLFVATMVKKSVRLIVRYFLQKCRQEEIITEMMTTFYLCIFGVSTACLADGGRTKGGSISLPEHF